MTLEEQVEEKLVIEIEAGLKEGFKLLPFMTRGEGRCCALGMVVRDQPAGNTYPYNTEIAAERLGISLDEALAIALGFDSGVNPLESSFTAIGVRLHERYNQTKAE